LDRLFNRMLKRTMDIIGATIGLTLSAPIMLVCGILIYLESPGPIFYRQIRTGRNGRNFTIFKLRSMRLDAEKGTACWTQKDDPRRLKTGAFMREWNLDEVPQFWNVLKGEMSLVGPRPERPELIANFKHQIPHYNARLASKPGLTGWAQVNGLRGDTSLVERVRYDLHYLENWSLWFDLQTMFLTFFKRQNAY
jgi:exopolysaccharide biosynthesis polyprenyl glycosylphosphotransferase